MVHSVIEVVDDAVRTLRQIDIGPVEPGEIESLETSVAALFAEASVIVDRAWPMELDPALHGPSIPDTDTAVLLARQGSVAATVPSLLQHLPELDRAVLHSRIGSGLSAEQTAQTLGISAATVRISQHRALARLRSLLAEDRPLSLPVSGDTPAQDERGELVHAHSFLDGTPVEHLTNELSALPPADVARVFSSYLTGRPDLRAVRHELQAMMLMGTSAYRELDQVVPPPSPSGVARQIELESAAKNTVLVQPMLTADEVAAALRNTNKNRRSQASLLRKASKLVGLDVAGRTQFPAFQIDQSRARILPVVLETNQRLHAAADPWGVASWWLSPSTWSPGRDSPADLAVAGQDDTVRALADTVLND